MALNRLENEIIELVNNKKIDVFKAEELFKAGANPNALEYDEPDRPFDDEFLWSTFFSECVYASQEKNPDLYPLLELFIKYGLDTNKYGPSIIGSFIFIGENNDIYEMTKLMLNNMDNKTDVDRALSQIGTEESFLGLFDDTYSESNDLFGLCELIEAFADNKPFNSFYRLPKKINEKFIKFNVSGDFVILNRNKVAVSESSEKPMISKIEMEKNDLIVIDNYGVYINNDDQNKFEDNVFTEYANYNFKDEKIIDLKFKHYEVELSPTSYLTVRVVIINFTNNKRLVYEEDINNKLETIKIV